MPAAPMQLSFNRRTRSAMVVAATSLLVMVAESIAPAAPPTQPEQPQRQLSPAAALQKAMVALASEAKMAWTAGRVSRQTSDFAASFAHAVDAEAVARRILRPVDKDPFIDAYIRWQLSSFIPAMPPLTDRQFEDVLRDLPRFIPNPRADERTIDLLLEWRQTNPLPPESLEPLNSLLADLNTRAGRCAELNRPAMLLRDWMESAAATDGARVVQAKLERCSTMIAGGWDVRELKSQLDERFAAAAKDAGLTAERRQRLIEQSQRLSGRRRLRIVNAAIVEKALMVETDETAVYDFDVTRWTKPLRDRED